VKNSLLRNGFYNTLAGAIRIALGLVTIPILIRLIGVEEYGLWTLASSIVGVVALAEAGLATTTTVFVSQDLGKEDVNGLSETLTTTFGAMLILATLSAIALWVSAPVIVSLFPKIEQEQQQTVVQAFKVGGIIVWARLLQQVLVGVEQGYQRYDLLNVLNTVHSLLSLLGLLVVVWAGGRTITMMQWQAVVTLVGLLSHVWLVQSLTQEIKLAIIWNPKKGLAIAKYSVLTWLTSLGGVLFLRGDRLIVASLLGSKTLGVYAVITDITGLINMFSALPVQPLLPTLSKLIAKADKNNTLAQKQIQQVIDINLLISLGLGSILFTLAPFVMQVMLDNKATSQDILAFQVATIIYALYSLNAVGYYVLFSVNAVLESMLIILFSGILSLLLITLASSYLGLVGSVIGNSGFLVTWMMILLAMKYLHINTKTWLNWFAFPVTFFVFSSMLNFVIMQQSFSIVLGIIQVTVLLSFFALRFYDKEEDLLRKILNSKKGKTK
jgi:O-antigen/teichoic acid export membrane protein